MTNIEEGLFFFGMLLLVFVLKWRVFQRGNNNLYGEGKWKKK